MNLCLQALPTYLAYYLLPRSTKPTRACQPPGVCEGGGGWPARRPVPQRTVRFVRNSTCTGPEELLQDIASCDCRPDEYEPRYGDCQGGARATRPLPVVVGLGPVLLPSHLCRFYFDYCFSFFAVG